ncbi:MAG TPA: enoyl-CoA hydratase/isomerase family protein [Terriglobales bacterium]|nr:enoyl-CoA hydratase/isomerase family protein [Terriglobales bacterium]
MILTIEHGPVRELRLNRPPVNALSPELIVALRQAVQNGPGDGVRALILSGAPGRYSGGLDVPLLLEQDKRAIEALWRDFFSLLGTIAYSPIPIVAAITGHAPAGGTVLALYCDWRVMAKGDYKLGLNEVQVGIHLPPILLAGLQRLVGMREAERLAVCGALLTPEEALEVGLVDELAPTDQVLERALRWCEGLLALPPEAMSATRRQARADLHGVFGHNVEDEVQRAIESWWSPETQSTLRALVERLGKKPAARSSAQS